jgi:hypothetical protein
VGEAVFAGSAYELNEAFDNVERFFRVIVYKCPSLPRGRGFRVEGGQFLSGVTKPGALRSLAKID